MLNFNMETSDGRYLDLGEPKYDSWNFAPEYRQLIVNTYEDTIQLEDVELAEKVMLEEGYGLYIKMSKITIKSLDFEPDFYRYILKSGNKYMPTLDSNKDSYLEENEIAHLDFIRQQSDIINVLFKTINQFSISLGVADADYKRNQIVQYCGAELKELIIIMKVLSMCGYEFATNLFVNTQNN
ncbi:hypothetical protein KC669_00705 [Candidatus Dojkabacteria bacterium]|uniref:Uncharacterized protein n=1 Tax=Candidatus Dojkabacteria bacterium TaxID=2099670 RepID=A0A955RL24_9BACT|nr:hypothetical protein [Candidatus Dojkabacteria bacterium]